MHPYCMCKLGKPHRSLSFSHTHTHTHTRTHTHTHTKTNAHTHTHTHTHTPIHYAHTPPSDHTHTHKKKGSYSHTHTNAPTHPLLSTGHGNRGTALPWQPSALPPPWPPLPARHAATRQRSKTIMVTPNSGSARGDRYTRR